MKKTLFLFITLLFTSFILVACGNGDEDDESTEQEVNETNGATETTVEAVEEEEEKADNEGSTSGIFEVTEEDQLDLKVGDTGVFQTSIGTFELTVEAAEIVGTELDGEASLLDELIIIDLTFKNIGDDLIVAEDIISTLEITEDDLDSSGYSNGAESFDSIEAFTGEIQPGEEKTAQFIGDILTSDEYFFRQTVGTVAAGASNQVIWTITDEEAR